MSSVLVTGSNGFLGSALISELRVRNLTCVGAVRRKALKFECEVGDINGSTDWTQALNGVETIVHCAARAHVMNDTSEDPLTAYRIVNVEGTRNLVTQAKEAGVKRFIFISSIKVNGDVSKGQGFSAFDSPNFSDPYGQSKFEAEEVLKEVVCGTEMELIIIRPPLVYGPGVKGNFALLINLVRKNIPLPFGAINNSRSLVAIDNLVDLVIKCIIHPHLAFELFLVSDDDDVSTTTLLRRISEAFDKRQILVPVPRWAFMLLAKISGKQNSVERLFGSLQVDISHTKDTLGWQPPVTMQQQLREVANAILKR